MVPVLPVLQALADTFATKKKHGLVQGHGSGYGGSGFKFDKAEDAKVKQARKSKAKVWERFRGSSWDGILGSVMSYKHTVPCCPANTLTAGAT